MYPCNYYKDFKSFFKKPLFTLPMKNYSPIKLYMDNWISFSDFKKVMESYSIGAKYYYPISLVISIKLKMLKNYLSNNKKKLIFNSFIIALICGSILCFK